MKVVRTLPRGVDFTALASVVINDPRLSLRAVGLLLWIMARPDGWEGELDEVVGEIKEGRDAVRTAFQELAQAGYVTRARTQGERGRWSTEVTVTDQSSLPHPSQSPLVAPTTGNPHVGQLPDGDPVASPQVAPTTGNPTAGNPGVGNPVVGATSENAVNALVAPTTGNPYVGATRADVASPLVAPTTGNPHVGGSETKIDNRQAALFENQTPPIPPFGGDTPPPSSDATTAPKPSRAAVLAKRGTRLPDDWEPSEALLAWVRANCSGLRRSENDKFKDYWRAKPGREGVKIDWDATWRNWMRTAWERQQDRRGANIAPATQGDPEAPTMSRRAAMTEGLAERMQARRAALAAGHALPPADPREITG